MERGEEVGEDRRRGWRTRLGTVGVMEVEGGWWVIKVGEVEEKVMGLDEVVEMG